MLWSWIQWTCYCNTAGVNKSIDITSKDTLENIFLNLCTDDNSIQIQLLANVVVYRFIHSELLRMSD